MNGRRDTRMMLSGIVAVAANLGILLVLSGFTAVRPEPDSRPKVSVRRIHVASAKPQEPAHTEDYIQENPARDQQRSQSFPQLPSLSNPIENHAYTMPAMSMHRTQDFSWSSDFSFKGLGVGTGTGENGKALDRGARRNFTPDLGHFYPRRAKRQGIEGLSYVRLYIDAKGSVERFEIVDSQPQGVFDTAVGRFVKHLNYDPAMRDGEAVPDIIESTFKWKLQ